MPLRVPYLRQMGWTALICAVNHKQLGVLELLLKEGANIHNYDEVTLEASSSLIAWWFFGA